MLLNNKSYIRSSLINFRNNIENLEEKNIKIFEKFLFCKDFLLPHKEAIIAGYWPVGSELNIVPLLEDLFNEGFKVALPVVVTKENIEFYSYSFKDKLVKSTIYPSLQEPKISKEDVVIPDLIFAPLVGCDLNGTRIGSGKGIYDRKICSLRLINPKLKYIGLCYDFQVVELITKEIHDQKLDYIITENKILNFIEN